MAWYGTFSCVRACSMVAPGRSRAKPRSDVLLVLVAGLAEVRVQVDECREEPPPAAVHGTRVLGLHRIRARAAADSNDCALLDDDIDGTVQAESGIDRSDVSNDQGIAGGVHAIEFAAAEDFSRPQ